MAIQPTGLRYYCSKQALFDGFHKIVALPGNICNRVNEFQKKSQLCSMAVNTAKNTAPISACFLTNYLLQDSSLNSYYMSTIGCMVYGAYLAAYQIKDCFYKDEHKTIDNIISQLDAFSKQELIAIGDEEKTPFEELLLSRTLTLHDCKHLIEDLLYNKTRTLFSWYSITGSHREPFERCLQSLNDNITQHAALQGRLSVNTKKALNEVLSKLLELKVVRSGILTDAYVHPDDTHPRLKDLSQALISFHQELLIQQSQPTFDTNVDFTRSIDRLIYFIDVCLETESIFTKISPTTHEKITLSHMNGAGAHFTTLREDLENLKRLPVDSVEFKEKIDGLHALLEACHNFLSDTPLSRDQLSLKRALEVQSLPQNEFKDDSLFETFEKALHSNLDPEEKRITLLQLLKTIDLTYDMPFEEAFLDEIAKHQPPTPAAPSVTRRHKRRAPTSAPIPVIPPRKWAKANLLTCGVNLEETFRELLIKLHENSETESEAEEF